MPVPAKQDTLARTIARKVGLIDLLGEDLYSIFESGKYESKAPFGFKSKVNFYDQNINLRKDFGKNYQFDINIKPDDYRLNLKYDFPKKSKY